MTCPTLLDKVVEAIRSAGATEEIIAAAVGAAGVGVTRVAGPRMSLVCEALIQAQASPQVINAMVGAYEAWERAPCLVGRPRKYADNM